MQLNNTNDRFGVWEIYRETHFWDWPDIKIPLEFD